MGKRRLEAHPAHVRVSVSRTVCNNRSGNGASNKRSLLKTPFPEVAPGQSSLPGSGHNGKQINLRLPGHRMKTSIEGLKEFSSLLEQVKTESGLTFLFTQHLDRRGERKLRKLLVGMRHKPAPVSGAAIQADLRKVTRELKSTESALDELREEITDILTNIQTPIIIVGKDLRIRYATDTAKSLLSKRFTGSERKITETMLALQVPDLGTRILHVIDSQKPVEHDIQDEEGRRMSLWIQPLMKSHKAPAGAVLTILDIDTQRSAEERLRSQEKITRGILDTTDDLFIMIDRNQQVGLINKRGCELLGYDEHEVIGRDWFDTFIPGPMKNEAREAFAQMIAREKSSGDEVEMPVLTSAGVERIIVWRHSLFTDDSGDVVGVFGSGRDVTEWRRAETARHESEEQLKLILSMERGDEFFTVDQNGNILSWMPGTGVGKKMRKEDVIGRHFSTFYPAEDFIAGKPMRALSLADAEGRHEDDGWRLGSDGSRHRAITITIPTRNPDGALRGFASVIHYLEE